MLNIFFPKGPKPRFSFLLRKEKNVERGDFQISALGQIILGGRRPQLDQVGTGLRELDFHVGSNVHLLCSLTSSGCQDAQDGEELERNLGEKKGVA